MLEQKRDGQPDLNLGENEDLARLKLFLSTPHDERKSLLKDDEYIPGVVTITYDLYPKSQEIHDILITYLNEQGYEVKDCTVPEPGHEQYFKRPSPEVQRQNGYSTGYASLKDDVLQRVAKCDSCSGYVSRREILTDGHTCENCGTVMYEALPKGSQVRFSYFFNPEGDIKVVTFVEGGDAKEGTLVPSLLSGGSLVVEAYDPETNEIYCYGELHEVEKAGIDYGSDALGTYRRLVDNGSHVDRIIVKREDISEIWGSKRNFREVRLFKGKEYAEFFEDLPVGEHFTIYEPWHWMPLRPSQTLHERIIHAAGMTSDKGYYYQDGRAAFYDDQLERMRRFVKNFTTLNIHDWNYMIRNASKSGPGMIEAIAHFCHSTPVIKNEPNIGNFMIGLADSIQGKPKTKDQIRAEVNYLRSEGFDGSVDELINHLRDIGMIPSREVEGKAVEEERWIQEIWDSLKLDDQS